MSGLELCPKCKKGHLYPVVTANISDAKGQIRSTGYPRDYQCAICGYKKKPARAQNVEVKDKVSTRVHKVKKAKNKIKTKAKSKAKRKKTKSR
ncbi:MAG TPA: hypothetical protein VI146_04295 [Nitrososphaeraceae archaeon]